jgi:2-polyprenyl-3-methyl-5-hydroxy-6-metoxy-1,4-benzoquinol methylase
VATDLGLIIRNLASFYNVEGKSVLHVGAGGGQLVEYLKAAGKVLGIDSDENAITALHTALERAGMLDNYSVVQKDWFEITEQADVVYFEFCLHEIDDPEAAVRRAQSLAPEILMVDHDPESRWSWYAGETEKITRSWQAARKFGVVREASHRGIHRFKDYAELLARLQGLEEPTLTRIREFEGKTNIEITMPYRMAVLPGNR